MKVLVLGNTNKTLKFIYYISEWKEYTVQGIVDYRNGNWGQYKDCNGNQIQIVSPSKAITMYQDELIDAFIMPSLEEDANNRMYKLLVANSFSRCSKNVQLVPISMNVLMITQMLNLFRKLLVD